MLARFQPHFQIHTLRKPLIAAAALLAATPAAAQTEPRGTESHRSNATRTALTTVSGDSGLWFVPSAEVLQTRRWSFSLYRVNADYEQGFTDVSHWPFTFAIGIADRLELFSAFSVVTRIDRDVRPLFFPTAGAISRGGIVNDYPFVRRGWTGSQVGDLWTGAKFNLTSKHRGASAAFALRALSKLPTAADEAGTGEPDAAFDAVVSKAVNDVDVAGFGGFILRGDPEGHDLLNGLRWGVGAAFAPLQTLRVTGELHGEFYTGDVVDVRLPHISSSDSSLLPAASAQRAPLIASLGITWTGRSGVFAGAGMSWNSRLDGRGEFGEFKDETGDSLGLQVRVGYHAGRRLDRIAAAPPPRPPSPENRPPSVRAQCNPCTVDAGKTSIVSAVASDPDGDRLTYRWNAAAGMLGDAMAPQTPWTAPTEDGPIPITVMVSDTRGGTASDAVTLYVLKPAAKEIVFEDVHFDFDRYSLRPEATRALDEAVTALEQNPELRLDVEGHTCNIGTAEYNLALGERRAGAVREYLAARGIRADRLRTMSYGEERPKHDNAREESRRLNRRAGLIVRVGQ